MVKLCFFFALVNVLLCHKLEHIYSVPFLDIGELGGNLGRHQQEWVPMSTRTGTTFKQGDD